MHINLQPKSFACVGYHDIRDDSFEPAGNV